MKKHFWPRQHRAGRSRFLTAVFATWQILGSPSHAQDIYAEIAKHQEEYVKLESDFLTTQRRMTSTAGTDGIRVVTYTQLEYAAQLLSSANREFSVLSQSLTLAALVTDARAVPLAMRVVQLQKEYMLERISNSAEFIEKNKHRAQDAETNRLLLEARDLLRSSVPFVERIPSVAPKR